MPIHVPKGIHATTFLVFLLASASVSHCDTTTLDCDHASCTTVISDSLSIGAFERTDVHGSFRVQLFPEFITSGQHLQSRNGKWVLHLQSGDGHLVLYPASCQGSSCPPTAGHRWANWKLNYAVPSKLKLEENGDLVVIDANGMVVWRTGTNVQSQLIAAWFIVQDDGDLVLYQQKKDEPNARATWRSNTGTGASEKMNNNGFCKCMREKFSTRDLVGQFGLVAKTSWEGPIDLVAFMRKHAIWPQSNTLTFDITTRITVNTTGKYEMQGLCDDSATFYIDGNIVLTVPKVLTFPSVEIALTSGDHILRIVGVNLGGPAGVALTITHDDASPAFTSPATQSLSGSASCDNTTMVCDHTACTTVISDSLSIGAFERTTVNRICRVHLFPQFITSGQHLQSRNGKWVLHLQSGDGHLVLYPASCQGSSCPPTAGHRWANWKLNYAVPSKLKLEENGDLVVIDANGMVVWRTGTNVYEWRTGTNVQSQLIAAWFIVQDDGDLVLYQQKEDEPNALATWRSNTGTGASEKMNNNGSCTCMQKTSAIAAPSVTPSCGLGKYFVRSSESTKSSCVTCPRGFACPSLDIEECRKGYTTNGDGQSSCSEMEPKLIFLVVWSALGVCFYGSVLAQEGRGALITFCVYIVVVIVMVCVIFVPEGSLGKECKAEAGTYCPPGYGRVVPCPMGYICKGGRVIESCNAPSGKYCGDNTRSDADFLVCPVDSVCMGGSYLPLKCAVSSGYFCNASSSKVKCPEGHFCTGNTAEKTECPDNTVSKELSVVKTDCVCKTGFTGPDGGPCLACEQGKFKTATGSAPCQGPLAVSPPPSDGMEKGDLRVTGVGVGGVGVESGDFLARLLGGIFGGAAGLLCCIIGAYWYFFQRQRHAATGIQINGAQRMPGMTMTATFTRETELMPIEIKPELMNPVRNPTAWDKYCNSLSLSDLWESNGSSNSAKKLYVVNRDCHEFSSVKQLFMETMKTMGNITITRIERVENAMLHDAYKVQRTNIAKYITKETDVSSAMEDQFVKWLFHGTKQETIDNIVNSGYLPMLAGSAVGAIWGNGTYFARDSKYSHEYTEAKNDELTIQSQRKMLLNRVIVGEWVQGAPGIKKYPLAKGEKYRQCNSLVNKVDDPSIFVIPHSNQAYPAYVITYTSA